MTKRQPPGAGRPPIVIRADATPQMGTGHVMRCLALAQAWQASGGRAIAAAAALPPALEARLRAEGLGVERLGAEAGSAQDAEQTVALARAEGAAWIVVDGYGFSGEYQRAIAGAGLPLLAMDDYGHAGHYWAGLVLNQNLDAREAPYASREPATRLLLGTEHVLLRREFWPWRGRTRAVPDCARRVLVTMGGADPENVTLRAIEALRQVDLPGLEARVVVGGGSPHLDLIRGALGEPEGVGGPPSAGSDEPSIELVENAGDMPALMAWADLAVSAAGTTCWELAFMRCPALLVILAENQRGNAEELARLGVAVSLGLHSDATPGAITDAILSLAADAEARLAMERAGAGLVDGLGAVRMAGLMAREAVRVCAAGPGDRDLLLEWANDPLTRQMSFRSQPISRQEHERWLARVLGDGGALLLVGEAWDSDRWVPCGQVRIDGDGTVSLAVAPQHRGRGLAVPLLRAGVQVARARTPGRVLLAYIKPENEASQRVFALAGFRAEGESLVYGQPCGRYSYGP